MLLKDKVAIVTGAQQGIGRATAEMFAQQGAGVSLWDLSEEKLKGAVDSIASRAGGKLSYRVVDITKSSEVSLAVETVVKEFGRIDIVVNNAGILKRVPLLEMQEADWDQVFAVNVKGTFLVTREAGKVMVRQKYGKIINISSTSAKKADALQAAYNSSKSAIIGLTRVTAVELGPYGISCNAICPGATDTEMVRSNFLTSALIEREWIDKTALKRLGKPADVAKVAVFLASELSDHITGEALIVSAGEVMGQ
jgi:NAD(P)-dependent dehydrogenase (short-subunit alcohol dehydrogenase family)